jgi:hypothetical protein
VRRGGAQQDGRGRHLDRAEKTEASRVGHAQLLAVLGIGLLEVAQVVHVIASVAMQHGRSGGEDSLARCDFWGITEPASDLATPVHR